MKDEDKTKEQLVGQLQELRQQVEELKKSEVKPKQIKDETTLLEGLNSKMRETHQTLEDNQEIIVYLKGSRLFSHFPEQLLNQLLPLSELLDFPEGTEILTEGKNNSKVYFLIRGRIGVYVEGQLILKLQRKGDIFGEMSIITNKPCAASVIAESSIRVFSIQAKDIGQYTDIDTDTLHHTLYRVFSMILSEKLVMTTAKAKEYEKTHRQLLQEINERKQVELELRRGNEILNQMYDGVTITDLEGKIVDWTGGAEKMWGYSKEEVLGKTLAILHKPEDTKTLTPLIIERMEKEGKWVGEIPYIRKDGTEGICETLVVPLKDEKNNTIVTIGVNRDITERKLAEESLKKSEELFRQLVENVQGVFWMGDFRKPEIFYISPAYEKIWGRSCESLYKNPNSFLEAVRPEDRESVITATKEQLQGKNTEKEYQIIQPNGEVRWIWDRGFPSQDEFGEVYQVWGIAEDITERKQLEAQLRQAHKMEALGTLAGGIAHDFNNLLVPILGITEMEYNKLDPESEMAERLKRVLDSARKAKDLVFQILVFSRKAESKKEVVYLKEIVDESLKLLRSTLPSTISIKYEVNLPRSKILADSTQIHQVIMNLCINASHAMPEGGELNIKTETVEHYQYLNVSGQNIEGTFVCLSVQDNGYGMDEQIIERIFEPFFTTKEKGEEKGTGLGLAMVSGILTQHEGHIEVESEVESDQRPGGTTFRVYLPLIISEEDADSEELPHPLLYGEENILFIDDEPMVNDTGTFLLEELGYHMTSFINPKEALEAFQAKPHDYDLVITDMNMSPMTGVVLAEKMREIRSDIPIILCTGYNDTVSENKLGEWKLDALIIKPYEQVQLSQVVRSVLDQIKS